MGKGAGEKRGGGAGEKGGKIVSGEPYDEKKAFETTLAIAARSASGAEKDRHRAGARAPQNGTSGAPGANGGRTGSDRPGGAGTDARRRKRDGKAKGKRRDGFRKVQRACPVSRQAFTGRVQPRMERTLRAMTPHFQSNITSALRSFPSFGD